MLDFQGFDPPPSSPGSRQVEELRICVRWLQPGWVSGSYDYWRGWDWVAPAPVVAQHLPGEEPD